MFIIYRRIRGQILHFINQPNLEYRSIRIMFTILLGFIVLMYIVKLPKLDTSLSECSKCINMIIMSVILVIILAHSYCKNRYDAMKYISLVWNISILAFFFQNDTKPKHSSTYDVQEEVTKVTIMTMMVFVNFWMVYLLFH